MPGFIHTKKDEEKWNRAKFLAEKAGHKEDWPYVTPIFKSLNGGKVSSVERVALRYFQASNVSVSAVLALLKKEFLRPEYSNQSYVYKRVNATDSVSLKYRKHTGTKKEEFVVSWYTGNPGRYWGEETFTDLKSAVAKINQVKDDSDRIYNGGNE